jgi:hypothetical protein
MMTQRTLLVLSDCRVRDIVVVFRACFAKRIAIDGSTCKLPLEKIAL